MKTTLLTIAIAISALGVQAQPNEPDQPRTSDILQAGGLTNDTLLMIWDMCAQEETFSCHVVNQTDTTVTIDVDCSLWGGALSYWCYLEDENHQLDPGGTATLTVEVNQGYGFPDFGAPQYIGDLIIKEMFSSEELLRIPVSEGLPPEQPCAPEIRFFTAGGTHFISLVDSTCKPCYWDDAEKPRACTHVYINGIKVAFDCFGHEWPVCELDIPQDMCEDSAYAHIITYWGPYTYTDTGGPYRIYGADCANPYTVFVDSANTAGPWDGSEDYPYQTIQAGIDAALDGDTVLVAPGTYTENIDFNNKSVALISTKGADSTVIRPADQGLRTIRVVDSDGAYPVIQISGFTFDTGSATQIEIFWGANATITQNVFFNNGGRSVYLYHDAYCHLESNLFHHNHVIAADYYGSSSGQIINNTFDSNERSVTCSTDSTVLVRNNIITNSTQYGVYGVAAQLGYNNVWNNSVDYTEGAVPGVDDISVDPEYADVWSFDYHLSPNSPCIDAGHPDPQYNDPDGSRNDIGAFPYSTMPSDIYISTSGSDETGTGASDNPFATIQHGVDQVAYGGTVHVLSGTYNEQVIINSKPVTVVAESGRANASVVSDGSNRVFTIANCPDTVRIIGFDISGGNAENDTLSAFGGGILSIASPIIVDSCLIHNNQAPTGGGGGVCFRDGAYGIIRNCDIYDNTAGALSGGGIMASQAAGGVMENNLIYSNTSGNAGGGIMIYHSEVNPATAYTITGNTIANNTSTGTPTGAGLQTRYANATVERNAIAFNTLVDTTLNPQSAGMMLDTTGTTLTVDCNLLFGNCSGSNYWAGTPQGPNDVIANPLFCDTTTADYTVAEVSPCLPAYNPCGVLIGARESGCQLTPEITAFEIQNEEIMHVIDQTPIFDWQLTSPIEAPQDSFVIAIGTDDDWTYAEMWNPAPFASPDTLVTYDGADLDDGATYYGRLKARNGYAWSEWYGFTFRMNTAPTTPVTLYPANDEIVDAQPTLWIQNATDAENDDLTYHFTCVVDTTYGEPYLYQDSSVTETPDSTGWTLDEVLEDNKRYTWRVRSFDGYEYSDWTPPYDATFWVDAIPEAPSAFSIMTPNPDSLPQIDMLPTFEWTSSSDPDPQDTVRYKLEVAINPQFTLLATYDSLLTTSFQPTDSLDFSDQYWWRVKAYDRDGQITLSDTTLSFWTWTLGDVQNDHSSNITDLTLLVGYLFNGGPWPNPLITGELTGDCAINVSDVTYFVAYLFAGGPPPAIGCQPPVPDTMSVTIPVEAERHSR